MVACVFLIFADAALQGEELQTETRGNSQQLLSETNRLLRLALEEIANLRNSHEEQKEEMQILKEELLRSRGEVIESILSDRRAEMHARHLSSVSDLSNYSGISVKRDNAMVSLGVDADVKLLRPKYGSLLLLADEVHVQGKLFVDEVEINADCCSSKAPIYSLGTLFNFSDCTGNRWNNTVSPFEITSAADTWVQKVEDNIDLDYEQVFIGFDDDDCQLNSYIGGETATGVSASDAFYVTRDILSFWSVGFTSATCSNRLGKVESSFVAVINAEDESEVWVSANLISSFSY